MKVFMITDQDIEGFHYWPSPNIDKVKFLGDIHRHVFNIRAGWLVGHKDREKEIFCYQELILRTLQTYYEKGPLLNTINFGASSCEHICERLLNDLADSGMSWCEVLEDGKGGARIEL